MEPTELHKSIDALLDDIFNEDDTVSKASPIDIAQDSETTADEAVNKVPKSQNDKARGAGRPKQISDVPQVDKDGRRSSEYDDDVSERDDVEDENAEAKKQATSVDQTTEGKGRLSTSSKAPASRPFKKSENEISDQEWEEFQDFKKAKAQTSKEEELRKSEDLIKSAVALAIKETRKENEELRKSMNEQGALLKALASQPRQSRSITGIEQLEKSTDPEFKQPESFSKSEKLDAAFELAKAGKISDLVVSEIEMTGTVLDREARSEIEKYLTKN